MFDVNYHSWNDLRIKSPGKRTDKKKSGHKDKKTEKKIIICMKKIDY